VRIQIRQQRMLLARFAYWIAYPGALAEWPPLMALRQWLHAEMALLLRRLQAPLRRRARG